MTLHEAILTVIRKNGEPMKPRDIAIEINKFSLYKGKSEKPISANQIWARANKYTNLLKITDDHRIAEVSYELKEQEDFLKWIKHFEANNINIELDIVLPYLLFLLKKSNAGTNDRSLLNDILDSNNPKVELLHSIDVIFDPNQPNEFYYTIESAIEKSDRSALMELIRGLDAFANFLGQLSFEDYIQLFRKIILQLSNVKSRNFEFGTPISLAKFVRNLVDVKPGQSICDPFAGFCILLGEVAAKEERVNVIANDLNKRVGVLGMMNLIISGLEHITFKFGDAFDLDDHYQYDLLVSNPPFLRSTLNLRKYGRYSATNSIELIYGKLKPRGRAVIIIPDSVLYTEDKEYKYLRRELLSSRAIRSIISLPNGIFQPFTNVPVSVIVLDKGIENKEIYFADLSEVSIDEFEYKSEEFANWYKKRRVVDGKSAIIDVDVVQENNSSYNLVPRKSVLKSKVEKFSSTKTVLLRELIKRKVVGKVVNSSNLNEEQDGVPYLRISDLQGVEGVLANPPKKYISDIELIQPIKYFVEPGTLVIARIGNYIRPVIYGYSEAAVPSSHLMCFTIDEEKVSMLYLLSELNSEFVKQQLDAIQIRGIGPNYFKEKDLLELRIRLGSKEEQLSNTIGSFAEDFSNYFHYNIYKTSYDQIVPSSFIKSSLKNYWNNLIHVDSRTNRALNYTKTDETPSKVIREKQIISSIKHRISQYISPINNDVRNLKYFLKDRSLHGGDVSLNEKINELNDASTLSEVFSRVENNLKGISKTFILMNDILYFDKEDSHFAKINISDVVHSAKKSLEDNFKDICFIYNVEPEIKNEELILQIDKDQIEELFRNFIFNSINHGFKENPPQKTIYIFISKSTDNNYLELNLINNGLPFPEDFTKEDFISFGRKGTDSNGTGIGGYLMNKIVENHEGLFDWLCNENIRFKINTEDNSEIEITATVYFKISLPFITN